MDKLQHLKDMYERLLLQGKVRSKKDLARQLGVNYPGLVSAFGGDPKSLTPSLLAKVAAFAGGEETTQTVPVPEPDIVIPAATAKMYADMAESIRILSELVAQREGQKGESAEGTGTNG